MQRYYTAAVVALCVTLLAQPAGAQTARRLLEQGDSRFCAHGDVWTRAADVVRGLLPSWKFTLAQREAIDLRFSDQSFVSSHPDRVQMICSATVHISSGGLSQSLKTRFDAVPQDQTDGFRLEASEGSELLRFLMGL